MRSVKKVTLKLIETFADKCDDPSLVATTFVPAMMDPVLGDYARAVPDARCGGGRCSWVSGCLGNEQWRGTVAVQGGIMHDALNHVLGEYARTPCPMLGGVGGGSSR